MKHIAIKKNQFQWPKIAYIILSKKQKVICGILPQIPVTSCGDYTLEKNSREDIKKYIPLKYVKHITFVV